jgi:Spy/CpxP family protein refolding chaperone
VAVKVQRPQVLSEVALDLFMVRALAPSWQKAQEINTDLVGLIDAYAVTFVNELDYTREAAATTAFSAAMAQRGLGSVTAPEIVPDLSSMHVLTTKWVDGERLSASDADDVPRLCGVALNAYLTMLLDTGTLHCDPHPGNLLRTTDGKLCILDFGMCLEVPTDLQLSLLEFIANLQAENYEDVPDDLVKLSFVPADKIDELRASGLTVALAQTIRIAAAGGGPKGAMKRLVAENKEKYREQLLAKFGTLDSPEATKERQRLFREDWQREMAEDAMARGGGMGGMDGGMGGMESGMGMGGGSTTADITAKVEEMQQQNSNVFAIPDYFVYMSRAFATLEGIGLSSDPDYAILKECFPYLAFRLLSDDSPRAQGALRTLLYGTGTELNLQKLGDVTKGLQSYTVSTSSVESGQGSSSAGRDAAVEQLASVVLSEEGNYVQSLLLREAAVALDAAARKSIVESTAPLRRLPSLPFPAPPAPLAAPLGALVAPITLPVELLRAALELQQLDERDLQRLDNLRILSELVSGVTAAPPPPSESSAGAAAGGGGSGGGGGGGGGGSGSGSSGNAALDLPRLRGQTQQLNSLLREATARRAALTRTGVRFGGTLAATQAERLRQRSGSDAQVSDLAARLAAAGATGLENVASAIVSLDESLAARSPGAGTTEAAAAPPPSLKAGGE